MFKYFRYVKEMRELKKQQMVYTTALLGRLYDFVDSIPDIAEMATKLKGLDSMALQKGIVEELVKFTKEKAE
jgi:hypothetical protein